MSDAKGSRVNLEINSETGSVDLIANGRHVVIHADGRVVIGAIGPVLPPPAIRQYAEESFKYDDLKLRDLGKRWPGAGSVSPYREELKMLPREHLPPPQFGLAQSANRILTVQQLKDQYPELINETPRPNCGAVSTTSPYPWHVLRGETGSGSTDGKPAANWGS